MTNQERIQELTNQLHSLPYDAHYTARSAAIMRERDALTHTDELRELERVATFIVIEAQAAASYARDVSKFAVLAVDKGYHETELNDVHRTLATVRANLTQAGEALRMAETAATKLWSE